MVDFKKLFSKEVTIDEQKDVKISIRPINLIDLVGFSQRHLPAMQTILQKVEDKIADADLIENILGFFPDFCSDVLQKATELDLEDLKYFPLSVQSQILAEIALLSFSSPESLKKAKGVFKEMISKVTPEAKNQTIKQ